MGNVMRRLARRHFALIGLSALILAGFQLLMCAIVANTDVSGALKQLVNFAPPMMQSMFAQTLLSDATDAGLIAFGWNHPVTHALGLAIAITLGTRAIAGEIENGAIELVLTQPISRNSYLLAHVLFALLAITAITTLGVVATAAGQYLFELVPFPASRLLVLLLNFVLLQLAVFGITFAFSAFGREAGRVALVGVLVALLSYLIAAVAALWPRIASLGWYSLHHYFDPRRLLVTGNPDFLSFGVLGGFMVLGVGVAFWRFERRDLP
jgi:ABC-2 type transport system permease protein